MNYNMKSKQTISGIILGVVLVAQVSMIPFNTAVYAVDNTKARKQMEGNIFYEQITDIAKVINNAIYKTSEDEEIEIIEEIDEIITMQELITTTLRETITISPTIAETVEVEEYQWYKDGAILEGKTERELKIEDVKEDDKGEYTLKIKTIVEENEEEYEASCNVVVSTFTTVMTKRPEITYFGEGFEITLRIENLKNVEEGLMYLGGQLEFDKNILEEVQIVAGEGWAKSQQLNEENLKFVTEGNNLMTEATDVFKIHFKVKEDIEETDIVTTTIAIRNMEASNGKMDIRSEKDAEIEVNIQKKPEDMLTSKKYKIENNEESEHYILGILLNTTLSKFIQNIETNTELEFSSKDGEILTDNDAIIKTGIKVKAGKLEFYLIVTGDITGNGEIGITDLAKLKSHYIGLKDEILTGVNLKAADMNLDGKVTITDLAQIRLKLVEQ